MSRKLGLVALVGTMVSMAFTANAWAQGATLTVTPQVASPGQVVTVNGSGFSQTGGGLSDASIRLSKRNGIELAGEPVDTAGRVSVQFPVPPNLPPGWYLLIGTQIVEANGRQKSFTPGRTRLRVVAAKAAATAAAPSSGDGGWPGPALPFALGGALVLLAAGGLLTARRLHNRQPLGS